MNLIEELVNKRWILKSKESETYYKIKDNAKEIRKKIQEKFGYALIINPYLIKLEKIPGKAEAWMGIQEFQTLHEYQMFCYLLMYLEDKEVEDQFTLSEISEYIQVQFPSKEIDLTKFHIRKEIVRVLKYALKMNLFIQNDGNEDWFLQDENANALYENTGISRYFIRNFTTDIMDYNSPEDFLNSEWIGMDEDRGIVRRQRIYRRLLLSCGVYKSNGKDDEDFNYLRNYRRNIEHDFQSLFSCELHLHASSAYLNLLDDCSMGKVFPSRSTKDDILLLAHHTIYERVKKHLWEFDANEQLYIDLDEYLKAIQQMIKQQLDKLPKTYQAQGVDSLAMMVLNYAQQLGFVELQGEKLLMYPVHGKLIGEFQGG